MQQQFLIIVAGGSGSRMNSDIPKQYIEINGVPIIVKTIKRFLEYNAAINIIICVSKEFESLMKALIVKHDLKRAAIKITIGGDTRFASVKNGLKLLELTDNMVGIHDAARPFVSINTIKNCFNTAELKGNAVPCIAVNESIRKVDNHKNTGVNRDAYKIIQTPQCFVVKAIKHAYEQEYSADFTDDASVLEADGTLINLVEGNVENIKITTPYDLQLANSFL